MTQDQHLLQQMVHNGADALAALAASVAASDDVTVLVTAALLSPAPVLLLAQAASAATTTRQRRLVAIAAAHVDGDVDLVDALARDHLADHPGSVLVAWISALSHPTAPTPKDQS